MGKKSSGPSISLDSFLDVLTCLEGVLMLVIISTGIDAAQTKVLIPTPMERASERIPVYVECRGDMLYPLDVAGLMKAAEGRMAEIARKGQGDQIKTLQALSDDSARVTNEYYEVDMAYGLVGQIAIRPNPKAVARGYEISNQDTLSSQNYMADLLKGLDKDKQRLKLIVRDDSFTAFKNAQRLAFLAKIETSVEVFDAREPIRFSKMLY
jgi:hypothetical protein